jgi:hypothetical protein
MAGGLCGSYAGNSGKILLRNCYNIGIISGQDAGGLSGDGAGSSSGNFIIINSYNTGDIKGYNAGGLIGSNSGYYGNCNIENCYNIGNIDASSAGGLCGSNTFYQHDFEHSFIIFNSFSYIEDLSGTNSGSILGTNSYISSNNFYVDNVYSNNTLYYQDGTSNNLDKFKEITNSNLNLITSDTSSNLFYNINFIDDWHFNPTHTSFLISSNNFLSQKVNQIGSTQNYFPLIKSNNIDLSPNNPNSISLGYYNEYDYTNPYSISDIVDVSAVNIGTEIYIDSSVNGSFKILYTSGVDTYQKSFTTSYHSNINSNIGFSNASLYFKYKKGEGTVIITGTELTGRTFSLTKNGQSISPWLYASSNSRLECEKIELNTDLTINNAYHSWTFSEYTISLLGKIIFDGKNNKLILNNCSGWNGFIQIDNYYSSNKPLIKNLQIVGNNNTNLGLVSYLDYNTYNYVYYGSSYLIKYNSLYYDLQNCSNSLDINQIGCGGLVPDYSDTKNCNIKLINCYNKGKLMVAKLVDYVVKI